MASTQRPPETSRSTEQREISRAPQPPQPVQVPPQRRRELEAELNFINSPGRHTVLSPASGSRSGELASLRSMGPNHPELLSFATAIYQPQFVHLIPASQARRAEAAGLDIFRRYLSRYSASGMDENNAVMWHSTDMTRTYVTDVENEHNTWNVQPLVYDKTHMRGRTCLPKYIAALHELMHVEETPRGAARDWDKAPPGLEILSELIPTIMTVVMADEAYKRVNRIPLSREVNYGQRVQWDGHSVPVGRIANFYRSLIDRYGSVGAAVASPESLEFMRQGAIPPRMITPSRVP
ncbi:MAG TPA: hypothetical protein VLD37_05500 [Candidatus Bilamarchaeum sp.]|nr:hypothetical protein [Candidatus Bilamarchaeum sp.]